MILLTLQVPHAFRICMLVGAEHFCAFWSRLVPKHSYSDTLSFYIVFLSFRFRCAAITEKEALVQNGVLKKTFNNIY